jgi:hypothetical protein
VHRLYSVVFLSTNKVSYDNEIVITDIGIGIGIDKETTIKIVTIEESSLWT